MIYFWAILWLIGSIGITAILVADLRALGLRRNALHVAYYVTGTLLSCVAIATSILLIFIGEDILLPQLISVLFLHIINSQLRKRVLNDL